MKKSLFKAAYEEAMKQLANDLSGKLTQNAILDGWDPKVARDLSVVYDKGVMSMTHNPAHAEKMFDHEYGTETSAPKGTIRKMYSSKDDIANHFAKLIEQKVIKL